MEQKLRPVFLSLAALGATWALLTASGADRGTTLRIDTHLSQAIIAFSAFLFGLMTLRSHFIRRRTERRVAIDNSPQPNPIIWYVRTLASTALAITFGAFVAFGFVTIAVQHLRGVEEESLGIVTSIERVRAARSPCHVRLSFVLSKDNFAGRTCLVTVNGRSLGPSDLTAGNRIVIRTSYNVLGTHVLAIRASTHER